MLRTLVAIALVCLAACTHAPAATSPQVASTTVRPITPSQSRPVAVSVADLLDTDADVRFDAEYRLYMAAADGLDVLGALRPLLADTAPEVRVRAIHALPVGALADGRPADVPAAVAILEAGLRDTSLAVRRAAASNLGLSAHDATAAAPALLRALDDPDADVRRDAAYALGNMGRSAASAVEKLAMLARHDPAGRVRMIAIRALGWLGPLAAPAAPALLDIAADSTDSLHTEALYPIGAIGASGLAPDLMVRARAVLAQALSDTATRTRQTAATALGRLGTAARIELVRALRHPDDTVASISAAALGALPAPGLVVVSGLLDALDDPRPMVWREAADALGGYGAASRAPLERIAETGSRRARTAARWGLRYLDRALAAPVADRCYRLERGAWTPDLGLKADTVFSAPPSIVRFTTRKRRPPREPNDPVPLTVLPANGARMSVHGPGGWTASPDGRHLDVWWSTGFSGISMSLDVVAQADTLRGSAAPFWDFPRAAQTAAVTGIRVACEATPGSESTP